MPWPRCGKSAGEKVVVVSRSACLLAPALPPTPSLENARKTVTPTPVAQSRTAGASLVDIVQVAAFACQAACRRNGKRDHGAGPASCSPLPASVSLSTSTHYQTQIFDLVFDVHVSAQRLSCVGILEDSQTCTVSQAGALFEATSALDTKGTHQTQNHEP